MNVTFSLAAYKAHNDRISAMYGLPTLGKLQQLCRDARAELALARRCQDPRLALGALTEAVGKLLDAMEAA